MAVNISRKSFLVGGTAALSAAALGTGSALFGCTTNTKTLSGIEPKDFESSGLASYDTGLNNISSANVATKLYTIKNASGSELCITNVGARIVSLMVPDKNNKMTNVVLGFNNLKDYINYNSDPKNYYGAIVGRYANRIGKGQFIIDGKQYNISTNEKGNTLHGGSIGFNYAAFGEVEYNKDKSLTLQYTSDNNEMGFPGCLNLKVTYTLTEQNTLGIYYEATTSLATPVNFSNHAYFILSGDVNHPITEDKLFIVSDKTTEIDSQLIPTGTILQTQTDSPFDFFGENAKYFNSGGRRVYDHMDKTNQQIQYGGGFDHNFVIMSPDEANKFGFDSSRKFETENEGSSDIESDAHLIATASSTLSGIRMDIISTEPGLQFYDCNSCDGTQVGLNGPFNRYCAFVLETQHYPDSPNHSNFPNTILRPGQTFKSKSEYKFSIQK